jgi:hypothetical protein
MVAKLFGFRVPRRQKVERPLLDESFVRIADAVTVCLRATNDEGGSYSAIAGYRGRQPDAGRFGMRGFALGAMLMLATVSGALAEDQRNVTIVNATGYGIKFLGFNNPGDDDWSDNELSSVLRNGASVYVKFNTADEGCVWNFKIDWADPGYPGVLWRDVDLCKISTLKLQWDRATNTTSYTAE